MKLIENTRHFIGILQDSIVVKMSVVYSDIEHSYSDIEYEVTSDDGLSTDDEFTIPASYAAEAATSDTGEIALLYDHLATSYMDFTNACPTTFHTIEYFTEILEKNGFTKIHEKKIMSESMKEKSRRVGSFTRLGRTRPSLRLSSVQIGYLRMELGSLVATLTL